MTPKPTIVLPDQDTPKKRQPSPSRRGKRAWLIYLDPETAKRLKAVAALADRSMQSFGEEAADRLIKRYGRGRV